MGKWPSGIRTLGVAVHYGSCYWQGWKKVSERAKGDSEVNASVTEGKWDVWKLRQTNLDVSRLPWNWQAFSLGSNVWFVELRYFCLSGKSRSENGHTPAVWQGIQEGAVTSPTGWPNNFFFTLTWVRCMPINYLALCFVLIFLMKEIFSFPSRNCRLI